MYSEQAMAVERGRVDDQTRRPTSVTVTRCGSDEAIQLRTVPQ